MRCHGKRWLYLGFVLAFSTIYITKQVMLPLGWYTRWMSDVNHHYTAPENANISGYHSCSRGITFTNSPLTIKRLGLPPERFYNLTRDSVRDFVFVTATDSSHFEESRDAIASLQSEAPGYHIHYYDLGLTQQQRNQINTWCNVTLHNMDLKSLAPHIATLSWKCWKFIIIHDALTRVHGAVFWLDASFRARQPVSEWTDLFELALSSGGVALPVLTKVGKYSNYAFTDPMVYQYLPTDVERQKSTDHACTCAILVYNTEYIYRQVLYWMYLCSMDPMCCNPPQQQGMTFYEFTKSERRDPAMFKGHRFDQSSMNIVLSNLYAYNVSRYTVSVDQTFISIQREATDTYKLSTC